VRLRRAWVKPTVFGALVVVAAVGSDLLAAGTAASPLEGFALIQRGPSGGTVWQGVIPDTAVPGDRRPSLVYLPPGYPATRRYPVVYLLHGLPGSPYSYVDGLRVAAVADRLIAVGATVPFIAVMPVAGYTHRYTGEWAGRWERYVVSDVVPWIDEHLPTLRKRSGRTLAGLSAGGFGAVDIGLRHPRLFSTLEAWSGYFAPPHDGPFRHTSAAALRRHDPALLIESEAALLRRLGERFFLSVGTTNDRWTEARTIAFSRELRRLGIRRRLWLAPGGHNRRFWRRQLPAALSYAVGSHRALPDWSDRE
jgi:enterochelin esterase-like enzyme